MWLVAFALLLPAGPSPIDRDEDVLFFPTYGRQEKSGDWLLDVRGWIFEPERDSDTRRELLQGLARTLELRKKDAETKLFQERARLFLVDNERGQRVSVALGKGAHALEASRPNGHFRGEVRLSAAGAKALAKEKRDPWINFRAVTREGDARKFPGRVRLIGPEGLSVLSDIDDTIKVSEVANPVALLENTFLREYRAVPGMPELFRRWEKDGAVFHYVSQSPWQLYPSLADLVEKSKLPAGTFHLTEFRWKDSSFRSLFESPERTKPKLIEPILKAFPGRSFVLVGDSGQKDPEIYGDFARKYPGQIIAIVIRDTTGEGKEAARYRKAFADVPEGRWQVFRDPAEVRPLKRPRE